MTNGLTRAEQNPDPAQPLDTRLLPPRRGARIPVAAQPGLIAFTENFPGAGPGPATGPVHAAAGRLAARPAAARHAWLAAHLAALRADRLTLQELP